jgi:hypothetical protein
MLLEIKPAEYDLLLDLLTGAMGSLREEIYKTEGAEYEAMLKQRESLLKGLLARLSEAGASGLVLGEPTSKR